MTADKVDDPMVGATEVIFHKNPVRLADEVPVSKEQKFYGFCQRGGFKGGLFAGRSPGGFRGRFLRRFGRDRHFMSAMLTYFPLSAISRLPLETEWVLTAGRICHPL